MQRCSPVRNIVLCLSFSAWTHQIRVGPAQLVLRSLPHGQPSTPFSHANLCKQPLSCSGPCSTGQGVLMDTQQSGAQLWSNFGGNCHGNG
jgi:hypothetical protein